MTRASRANWSVRLLSKCARTDEELSGSVCVLQQPDSNGNRTRRNRIIDTNVMYAYAIYIYICYTLRLAGRKLAKRGRCK